MFHFPLIDWLETSFYKWIERPDDYDKGRWGFYKKCLLGLCLGSVILWFAAEAFDITGIVLLCLITIYVLGTVSGIGRKKQRLEWKQNWWSGQYGKYEIFLHW